MDNLGDLVNEIGKMALREGGEHTEHFFEFASIHPEYFALLSRPQFCKQVMSLVEHATLDVSLPFFEAFFASYTAAEALMTCMCDLIGHYGLHIARISVGVTALRIRSAMAIFAQVICAFASKLHRLSNNKQAIACVRHIIEGVYGVQSGQTHRPDEIDPTLRSEVNAQMEVLGQTLIGATNDIKCYVLNGLLSPLVSVFLRACSVGGPILERLTNDMIFDEDKLRPMVFDREKFDFYISDRNAIHFYTAVVESNRRVRQYVLNELTSRFLNNYDMDSAHKLLVSCMNAVESVRELENLSVSVTTDAGVLRTCLRLGYPSCFHAIVRTCLRLDYDVAELFESLFVAFCCSRSDHQGLLRCLLEMKSLKSVGRTISSLDTTGTQILCDILDLPAPSQDDELLIYHKNGLVRALLGLSKQELLVIANDANGSNLFRSIRYSTLVNDETVCQRMLVPITEEVRSVFNLGKPSKTRCLALGDFLSLCDLEDDSAVRLGTRKAKRKEPAQTCVETIPAKVPRVNRRAPNELNNAQNADPATE